jgi:hypothetical protein
MIDRTEVNRARKGPSITGTVRQRPGLSSLNLLPHPPGDTVIDCQETRG